MMTQPATTADDVDSVDAARNRHSHDTDLDHDHDQNQDHDHDDTKQSKRDRFKFAINRTKTKINKVKEEYETKRQLQQQAKAQSRASDDVDDFLSAGRPSTASSQRPTITSNGTDVILSNETLSTPPRPSTAESRSPGPSYPSPRRTPISVPRIDVSSATRFPNAKEIDPQHALQGKDSDVLSNHSSHSLALLKPDYKIRSQSSSSLASVNGPRRARLRGLSVGFANAPPVVIGEGGDEAEAPAIEISRAKERARSASPQGRRARPNIPQPGSVPSRNDADMDFVPKPFARTQTGFSSIDSVNDGSHTGDVPDLPTVPPALPSKQGADFSLNESGLGLRLGSGPGPQTGQAGTIKQDFINSTFHATKHDETFLPRSIAPEQQSVNTYRTADTIPAAASQAPERQPPKRVQPSQLPPMQTTGLDLKKEFELTLGISTPSSAGSTAQRPSEAQIIAPKPKRAPPSYDLIEGGGPSLKGPKLKSVSPAQPVQNTQPQHSTSTNQNQYIIRNPPTGHQSSSEQQFHDATATSVHRKLVPHPQQEVNRSKQTSMNAHANAHGHGHGQDQIPVANPVTLPTPDYYPPPPQRTLTQTARIPQKINPVQHQSRSQQQPQQQQNLQQSERHAPPVMPQESQPSQDSSRSRDLPDQESTSDGGYYTFADHQKRSGAHDLSRRQGRVDLRAITIDDHQASPSEYSASSTTTTPGRTRFYEQVNQNKGTASEGFI